MFKDRKDAGKRLAEALKKYTNNPDTVVLAIPRGGVEIGYEIAKRLNLDFSLIISRKLPVPGNPELGFGAVAEDGSSTFIDDIGISQAESIVDEQMLEAKRRVDVLRQGPFPNITGKTVILTDDGLAMGFTMKAAIMMCKKRGAGRIIVAVPVSGSDTAEVIDSMVDEFIALEIPLFFRAVAQVYEHWHDVSDKEVIDIMKKGVKNYGKL